MIPNEEDNAVKIVSDQDWRKRPANMPPIQSPNLGNYAVFGIVAGTLFGFVATLLGLIFIACADDAEGRTAWRKFTLSTMLGWILLVVLWWGSCVACMAIGGAASGHSH
jgi:uncharacterized membrane protein